MKEQDIQQPIFKELKEDKNYLIYNDGRIFDKRKEKYLTARKDKQGNIFYVLPIKEPCAQGNKKKRILYKDYLISSYFNSKVSLQTEWKIIPFNPRYIISKNGEIKNISSLFLLSLDRTQRYIRIQMAPNKNQYYYLHRLVYCVFNDDYNLEGCVIQHKDGDIYNNKLDNLCKVKIGSTTISQESRVK